MDDKTIQKKLDKIADLCNELSKEAHARYGAKGNLFFESEGSFHLMDGDSDGSGSDRQTHVKFSSKFCHLGAGAW